MRYFFDFVDNGEKTTDCEGIELVDDTSAREQASLWLSEVVADEVIPNDGRRAIGVEVRNAKGVVISSVGSNAR